MGFSCSICKPPPLDPEVEEILKTVASKSPDIIKNCVTEKNKIDEELKELLEERKKKVGESKDKSSSELETLLKSYNKKELKIEKKLISNELDKMHTLWELGLELTNPLKNYTIKKLTEKLDKTPAALKPAVNGQISEIKAYTPKQFLNSTYGKPLKTALVKQGMSNSLLKDFKKNMLNERKQRRKEERNTFDFVKKNEFPPEDEFEFNVDELYESIFEEYQEEFKTIIGKNKLKIDD